MVECPDEGRFIYEVYLLLGEIIDQNEYLFNCQKVDREKC